ncbi:hypothetical protein K438DRAFT_1956174 [Mycena galopus ATCC 62051]|nr:hypothetical protein K438DRAFT_1956174 [Mycena galopus ATCC 62051]
MPPKPEKKKPYFDVETGQVNIHPPSRTRPGNPLNNLAYNLVETEAGSNPSSTSTSTSALDSQQAYDSRKQRSLVRKLLRTDQRDFLTGSKSYLAKAAHLFNVTRKAPKGQKDVGKELITSQHPLKTADVTWRVLVLYPDAFPAPEGLRVMRPDRRSLREEPELPLPLESWADWITCIPYEYQDGLFFLAEADGASCGVEDSAHDLKAGEPSALELQFRSIRAEEDQLSLFSMIVVTAAKIRAFIENNPPPCSPALARLHLDLQALLQQIFFLPDTLKEKTDYVELEKFFRFAATPSAPPMAPMDEDATSHGQRTDHEVREWSRTAQVTPASDGFASSSTLLPPSAPEPEFADGLTGSEYIQLLRNAQNPRLNAQQRADSSMMLLFGANAFRPPPRPFNNPLVTGVFDADSDSEDSESDDSDSDDSDSE